MVMPWSTQGEDERRFRRILLILALIALVFLTIAARWKLPPRDRNKTVAIPQRMVELVKKKQQLPPPEPKPVVQKPEKKEEKPVEKKEEPKVEKPKVKKEEPVPPPEAPKPPPVDTQQVRAKAETKGVLAFKNNFADLLQETAPRDTDARISNSGKQATTEPQTRSIITAQAGSGSGGINTATLSRQGVGGGQGIASPKMEFAQVESGLGGGKAGRGSTGRTEEEYQVVFDRYKSALDRLYQRELRNDPTLSGKIMLSITIEPDGRVSSCTVKSTDLASPTLLADVVDRVRKINFGAKEGVVAVTILFPIDFKPSS